MMIADFEDWHHGPIGIKKVAVSSSLRPLKPKCTIESRAKRSSINLIRTLLQYTCFSHTVKTRNILRVLRVILVILPEHPSDTKVFTLKMEILLEPTLNKLYGSSNTISEVACFEVSGKEILANKMAKENLPAPSISDEQLVLVKARLPYGKINLLLDLQKLKKNQIFRIYVDILHNTNFFRAFSASANVPSIYIQQFWNTLTQEVKTRVYRFQLDEQWFTLSSDLLCDALEITPVDPSNPFVSPLAGEIVMDFVNEMGYPKEIHFVSHMHVNNLFQSWRAIQSLINQCLTGKTSGNDKPRHPGIQTFFTHRDSNEIPSKKPTPYIIPYCRFTKLIIYYLGSKYNIHRRPESPRHVTGDDFLLGNLKFVPKGKKDEVFGMPIPKELITEAIQKSEYYKKYVEMAARKVQVKEGGKKKTAPKADKPVKPTTAKQPKPKPVKEKSTKPTPLQKAGKGKVKKVRNVKSGFQLVDEEEQAEHEEVHHEPEPQGKGEDYDLNRVIQMSLETFQAHELPTKSGGSPTGIHGLFSGWYCGLASRKVTLGVSMAWAKGVTTGTLCALSLDKLTMPPHFHKKFHMGVAIAKGCRGYYKPGKRAWVRRGSHKSRIQIDMYPYRVEESDSDLESTARSGPRDSEMENTGGSGIRINA
ncbi:hypothetical protein Tco_1082558 [Tanacetum coccineum]|uniref:Histone deacetylase 14 n=1 Tax=Tanacetum coccineum TaxID=301880 RepID=A0ABQ5I2U8_9ASTR